MDTPETTRIKRVEKKFGVSILKEDRHKKNAYFRQIVMLILRDKEYSLTQIARIMKRDHTTVLHGVEKMSMLLPNIPEYVEVKKIFESDVYPMPLYDEEPAKDNKFPYKWKRVYKKKGYRCEMCGFDEFVEVHHVIKRGGDKIENLLVLCPNCHTRVHRKMKLSNESEFPASFSKPLL